MNKKKASASEEFINNLTNKYVGGKKSKPAPKAKASNTKSEFPLVRAEVDRSMIILSICDHFIIQSPRRQPLKRKMKRRTLTKMKWPKKMKKMKVRVRKKKRSHREAKRAELSRHQQSQPRKVALQLLELRLERPKKSNVSEKRPRIYSFQFPLMIKYSNLKEKWKISNESLLEL